MTCDLTDLARRRHRETQHEQVEWLRALESARHSVAVSDLNDTNLERFAVATRSPVAFTSLIRLFYQDRKTHPIMPPIAAQLVQLANESAFTLPDWVDSIGDFQNWLTGQQRKADLRTMIEYLSCCVASPDAREGRGSLTSILADMLRIYGYNG